MIPTTDNPGANVCSAFYSACRGPARAAVTASWRPALAVALAAALILAASPPLLAQDSGGAVRRAQQPEQVGGRADRAAEPEDRAPQANDRGRQPPPAPPQDDQDPVFRITFTDAVELMTLVNYISDQLGIQIVVTDGGLFGQKIFLGGVPLTIPREQILFFLNTLLEQKNYTMTRGIGGVYMIRPIAELQPSLGVDPFAATRVIATPGMRPSSLATAIATVAAAGGVPGAPGAPGLRPASANLAYLDDLGVIMVTATPRLTQLIEEVVQAILAEQARIGYQRFELRYVAAAFARDRVMELIGGARFPRPMQQPGEQQQAPVTRAIGGLANLDERLTVDPQSNALLFRGRPDESHQLTQLLAIVDVPNTLVSRWYNVGRASQAIAAEGQRQGLGSIVVEQGGMAEAAAVMGRPGMPPGMTPRSEGAGAGFIIFQDIGGFVYRGTQFQHEQVDRLIAQLGDLASAEIVVVEFYKLRHAKADEVAEHINSLIQQQLPTGTSPLLGRDLGRGRPTRVQPAAPPPPETPPGEGTEALPAAPGAEIAAIRATEDTFVLADEANNQVVVKAPKRLQPQFARLIDKFDLRRPQVYIDAKIVALTASDEFRLRVETQILAGQFGVNTNFGVGTIGGDITDRKLVPPLGTITAAVIKSQYVPIIINAMATQANARVLATPQLLVDDNEEAEVSSIEIQPYAQISRATGLADVITQGGTTEAGTRLRVRPQISEGGYLRLEYEIEQSAFIAPPTAEGLQPPTQENKINSASVTIPSDATIVVGGLRVSSEQRTVLKVPLLGDIPIVGHLFRDTRSSNQSTTLYVFITPTVLRDPFFADARLLTRGPAAEVGIEVELPARKPVRIEILGRGARPMPPQMAPVPPEEPERRPAPASERSGWVAPTTRPRPADEQPSDF